MSGFEKVCVTRQDNQLMISWQGEDLGAVQVYQAFVPDVSADEDYLLGVTEQSSYTTAVQPHQRPYFLLTAQNRRAHSHCGAGDSDGRIGEFSRSGRLSYRGRTFYQVGQAAAFGSPR